MRNLVIAFIEFLPEGAKLPTREIFQFVDADLLLAGELERLDSAAAEYADKIHFLPAGGKNYRRSAFEWALEREYSKIATMRGDYSHKPRYLPNLFRALEESDLAIGSRYVKGGGSEGRDRLKALASRLGNLCAQTLLFSGVKDMTGEFRAYRREALEACEACQIEAEGAAFQIELLYRAIIKGFSVKEIPAFCRFLPSEEEKTPLKAFKTLAALSDLRIRAWRGKL